MGKCRERIQDASSLARGQRIVADIPTGSEECLSYDAATNTVTFRLEAGALGSARPFNFNGFTNGDATLVVPASGTVVINFVNNDAMPHSAEIIADSDPVPLVGVDPAIPRARTRDLSRGIPQGGSDVITFVAPPRGSFRIFCGVPGHGDSGMWIRLKVEPSARRPEWIIA
jgi:sulfocyanin